MRHLEKKTKIDSFGKFPKKDKISEIDLEIVLKRKKTQKLKKMDFGFFFQVAHMNLRS